MASYNVLILAVKPTEATSECHLLLAPVSHQMLLQRRVRLQGLTGRLTGIWNQRLPGHAASTSCKRSIIPSIPSHSPPPPPQTLTLNTSSLTRHLAVGWKTAGRAYKLFLCVIKTQFDEENVLQRTATCGISWLVRLWAVSKCIGLRLLCASPCTNASSHTCTVCRLTLLQLSSLVCVNKTATRRWLMSPVDHSTRP